MFFVFSCTLISKSCISIFFAHFTIGICGRSTEAALALAKTFFLDLNAFIIIFGVLGDWLILGERSLGVGGLRGDLRFWPFLGVITRWNSAIPGDIIPEGILASGGFSGKSSSEESWSAAGLDRGGVVAAIEFQILSKKQNC